MSRDFGITKSRSSILWYGLWSTVQITSYPMAVITSRNRISRFRGFRCHCSRDSWNSDSRFFDEKNQRSISQACFCRSDGWRVSASDLTAQILSPTRGCKLGFRFILDSMVTIEPWSCCNLSDTNPSMTTTIHFLQIFHQWQQLSTRIHYLFNICQQPIDMDS